MTNTLEERIAQAIAFSLTSNTDLPDWLQTPALGRNMLPLGELAAPAVVAVVGETLADLRERLVKADTTLKHNAVTCSTTHEETRLKGKAEGVRLALSYLDETLKEGNP